MNLVINLWLEEKWCILYIRFIYLAILLDEEVMPKMSSYELSAAVSLLGIR